jgi:hypothetical protein
MRVAGQKHVVTSGVAATHGRIRRAGYVERISSNNGVSLVGVTCTKLPGPAPGAIGSELHDIGVGVAQVGGIRVSRVDTFARAPGQVYVTAGVHGDAAACIGGAVADVLEPYRTTILVELEEHRVVVAKANVAGQVAAGRTTGVDGAVLVNSDRPKPQHDCTGTLKMVPMDDSAWIVLQSLEFSVAALPPAPSQVYDALDEAWGPGGWSCSFSVASARPAAVVCTLEMGVARRSGVGEGPDLSTAAAAALWAAAQQAGLGRAATVKKAPVAKEAGSEKKPSAQDLIDKLIVRLREAGKGREAAALVVKYGGYGADPEATKKLYGELRALLMAEEAG